MSKMFKQKATLMTIEIFLGKHLWFRAHFEM